MKLLYSVIFIFCTFFCYSQKIEGVYKMHCRLIDVLVADSLKSSCKLRLTLRHDSTFSIVERSRITDFKKLNKITLNKIQGVWSLSGEYLKLKSVNYTEIYLVRKVENCVILIHPSFKNEKPEDLLKIQNVYKK